jgi:hypothetical protein
MVGVVGGGALVIFEAVEPTGVGRVVKLRADRSEEVESLDRFSVHPHTLGWPPVMPGSLDNTISACLVSNSSSFIGLAFAQSPLPLDLIRTNRTPLLHTAAPHPRRAVVHPAVVERVYRIVELRMFHVGAHLGR